MFVVLLLERALRADSQIYLGRYKFTSALGEKCRIRDYSGSRHYSQLTHTCMLVLSNSEEHSKGICHRAVRLAASSLLAPCFLASSKDFHRIN